MAFAQESALIDFEIKDQFKQKHSAADYRDTVLVVFGSDKDGSRYAHVWTIAVQDALPERSTEDPIPVALLQVADVRGVPFFIKGSVRGKFSKKPKDWVLLDWKGRFAKAYRFEKKACNVLVFNRDGALVHQTHGRDLESEKVNEIVKALAAARTGSVEVVP